MVCKLHNWVWATGAKRAIKERIRPEHQPLLSFWLQQSWPDIRQGSLQHGSWKDVRDAQLALRAAIEELRQCEEVSHLDKFARRLQREPSGDPGCNEGADPGTQEGVDNAGSTVRVLQGARNNLTGFAAEFYVLLIAPCAIGLSRPMHAATTEHIHQDTSSSVEVDVVAAQGCAWIEVKAITGALTMRDWLQPNRSCCTSLKAQISRYCMAASSTSASVAWAQPAVVLFLPLLEALAPDVEQDMLTMGCTPLLLGRPPVLRGADLHSATEADSLAAAALGQAHDDTDSTTRMWAVCERSIPPRPLLANLDATTLCALVSLLSNDDASKPWYADWARGNPHWEQCRQQELEEPAVPAIAEAVQGMRWISSAAAVEVFSELLRKFAGPEERRRWEVVSSRIRVYPADGSIRSDRVAALVSTTAAHKHVLTLSDAERAVLVTANGRLIQRIGCQGVHMPCVVHHAVWLTGQ